MLVVLAGTICTLGLDQAWLRSWVNSGRSYPLSQRLTIDLPPGKSLVYYESPDGVPMENANLQLYDSDGDRLPVARPSHDISYRMMFGGMSGRALWQIDIPRAGQFTFICYNFNFTSDREIPPDDRVVFLKQPDSIEQVGLVRSLIQVTGATITVTLVILLYTLHGIAVYRRAAKERPDRSSRPAAA